MYLLEQQFGLLRGIKEWRLGSKCISKKSPRGPLGIANFSLTSKCDTCIENSSFLQHLFSSKGLHENLHEVTKLNKEDRQKKRIKGHILE